MRKILLIGILSLAMILSSCSTHRQSSEELSESPAVTSEELSEEGSSSEKITLLEALALGSDVKIQNISYKEADTIDTMDSPRDAYIRMDDYGDEVADVLNTIHIQDEIKKLPEDFEPPTEQKALLLVSTADPEFCTASWILPDGTVYLKYFTDANHESKDFEWYSFQLENGDYDQLTQNMETVVGISRSKARDSYSVSPLDYSISPETEVIGISVNNSNTDLELTVSNLSFEKNVGGNWEELNHSIVMTDMDKVAPADQTYFYFDPDKIEGSREEGEYRINITLVAANGTHVDLSCAPYKIEPHGRAFVVPPIENLNLVEYNKKYINPWVITQVCAEDYDREHYMQHYIPEILYGCIQNQNGDHVYEYQDYTPAKELEDAVQSRFYLSTEELRESPYYDAERHAYRVSEGIGGGPVTQFVTKVEEKGDTLFILTDWYLDYSGGMSHLYTSVTMFDLEANGEYKIAANKRFEEKLPEDFDITTVFS